MPMMPNALGGDGRFARLPPWCGGAQSLGMMMMTVRLLDCCLLARWSATIPGSSWRRCVDGITVRRRR